MLYKRVYIFHQQVNAALKNINCELKANNRITCGQKTGNGSK